MSTDKRSTPEVLGIPKEFGVVLLTLALILVITPYLGGIDLGIFKVPDLPPHATSILRYLGPVLFILFSLIFLPYWPHRGKPQVSSTDAIDDDSNAMDDNSKYILQSITDIVKVEATNHGIHIDGLQISDRLHINDLVRICTKAWFPEKSTAEVTRILQNARAKAFTRKYAEPREDEKLEDVTKIKIDGLKPWQDYFISVLNELGVKDPNQLDIINVGIGNGYAEEPFLSKIHSFKAVDISREALKKAKKKYPQMTSFACPAEDLIQIPNKSVDLYVSLRTYQSTLFDRRSALHEAYRILRNGGIILLSVPIMFLRQDGKVLAGLIPPASSEPSIEYARQFVARIQAYLTILNFQEVKTDERSPFEIFISVRR